MPRVDTPASATSVMPAGSNKARAGATPRASVTRLQIIPPTLPAKVGTTFEVAVNLMNGVDVVRTAELAL